MVALIFVCPEHRIVPGLAGDLGRYLLGRCGPCHQHRAYGFVLAGYTAAMVGLPALAHPDGAFMAAVWRVLEISLGILCSTVVSAAILPKTAGAAMHDALYKRFGVFAGFVAQGCATQSSQETYEDNMRFISESVWAWKACAA